jgi:hypothetical protein
MDDEQLSSAAREEGLFRIGDREGSWAEDRIRKGEGGEKVLCHCDWLWLQIGGALGHWEVSGQLIGGLTSTKIQK